MTAREALPFTVFVSFTVRRALYIKTILCLQPCGFVRQFFIRCHRSIFSIQYRVDRIVTNFIVYDISLCIAWKMPCYNLMEGGDQPTC